MPDGLIIAKLTLRTIHNYKVEDVNGATNDHDYNNNIIIIFSLYSPSRMRDRHFSPDKDDSHVTVSDLVAGESHPQDNNDNNREFIERFGRLKTLNDFIQEKRKRKMKHKSME